MSENDYLGQRVDDGLVHLRCGVHYVHLLAEREILPEELLQAVLAAIEGNREIAVRGRVNGIELLQY